MKQGILLIPSWRFGKNWCHAH